MKHVAEEWSARLSMICTWVLTSTVHQVHRLGWFLTNRFLTGLVKYDLEVAQVVTAIAFCLGNPSPDFWVSSNLKVPHELSGSKPIGT